MSEDEVISVKQYLESLINEHDKSYMERFRASEVAVNAALAAQEKAVNAAFLASEKAIIKAEESQRVYNIAHNDIVRKMDDQYSHMIPRTEAVSRIESLNDKIDQLRTEIGLLRDSQSQAKGTRLGMKELGAYLLAIISVAIAFILHYFK